MSSSSSSRLRWWGYVALSTTCIITGWSAGVALSLWANRRARARRRAAHLSARQPPPPSPTRSSFPSLPPPASTSASRTPSIPAELLPSASASTLASASTPASASTSASTSPEFDHSDPNTATEPLQMSTSVSESFHGPRELDAFDVASVLVATGVGAKVRPAATRVVPMYVIFDLESTGLDTVHDHITQMAAVVLGADSERPGLAMTFDAEFVSYVKTSRPIPRKVTEVTGITAATLADAPPFATVFHTFIGWLAGAMATRAAAVIAHIGDDDDASDLARSLAVRPVLVAHNGNTFDFPLLLNEMRRAFIPLELFSYLDIHTVDSLALFRSVKARPSGFEVEAATLRAVRSLSLTKLYPAIVGSSYKAHDALADVRALGRLVFGSALTSRPLMQLLTSEFVVDPLQQLRDLVTRLYRRELRDRLVWPSTKKPVVSSSVINRLVTAELVWEELVALRSLAASRDAFVATLTERVALRQNHVQDIADFFDVIRAAASREAASHTVKRSSSKYSLS
ncbi:DNA polymerase subunit III [Thecamonas trahens ATCC 50062]|uniref:DNA polymerase subunit III n=1 Tax=Thecamonas trahens ATCC 50062 TaxID=461836 RepID=A0A0L0D4C8_THETB|nr:DNA polymerase subunit III [Thecamonas trahens ATCC 50062]KNC47222.1 DNA polymerase subunit III [Thecamonas trahens ATCC 50062]|eukprot:XP_013759991.1 DNA polymerase subunit III [Thecamonas trahens ATCC 50062]